MANIKFLTGSKAKIDSEMSIGSIDAGDVILTSDTDEIVFVNPMNEKRVMKSKTQKDYVLNGTSLGALEDGSTISAGTSIDELLAMITQKKVPASYTNPLISLTHVSGTAKGNYEAGTVVEVSLKSAFTQNDAGAIQSHNILKNDVVEIEGGAINLLESAIDGFTLGDETITFKSEASYAASSIKNDNLGNPSPENAIAAGTKKSLGISFTGQRKYFYGTGVGEVMELNSDNIRGLAYSELNPTVGTEFSIPVEIGQQYVIFAYPSSLKDVSQVMYVETNDTGMAPSFNKTLVNVEGANGFDAKEYKVYTYKMAIPAPAPMTFKVTI